MIVKLTNVRLSYPNLFEAKAAKAGDTPRFSAAFILPKTHPDLPTLRKAIEDVGAAKWGAKWASEMRTQLSAGDKLCLHNGDAKASQAAYAGNLYVNASSSTRPTVIDRNRSPLTATDGRPYGGCYVVANLELWAQDNQHGKRINASLRGVQFYADGDAFGGGSPANADEFESLDVPPATGTDPSGLLG